MANLSVRRIDDETYEQLRVRAAKHGVSMEEEVRQILRRAVSAPEKLGELALSLFGAEHGVELEVPERTPHNPPDLGS
jgi:plasmid stability protein